MEFGWSAEEDEFRSQVRAAIAEHVEPGWSHWDRQIATEERRDQSLRFCQALAAEGLLTPQWPAEYGGRSASGWEEAILGEEAWGSGEPRGPQYMNVNWIGPAIMLAGSPEQKDYHLGRISRADVLWAQGFSEPEAGSDLAALRTAAVRDGDDYVVNGQKVWTSYAHFAEFCFLLCRTDPTAERHAGISIFLVPMDLPGIEVRDIPSPFAPHLVHEIFFTDVRVPASCLLGGENEGWGIITSVLANERAGVARHEDAVRVLDELLDEPFSDLGSPDVQAAAGEGYAVAEATRMLNYLAIDEREHDRPGRVRTAAPVAQAGLGLLEPVINRCVHEIAGPEALPADSVASLTLMKATASPIAAGALEIQFNLIARHGLGLPREGSRR